MLGFAKIITKSYLKYSKLSIKFTFILANAVPYELEIIPKLGKMTKFTSTKFKRTF